MNQLRIDPLTGQQVLIAADRSLRPQDFVVDDSLTERSSPASKRGCPFCAGHEQETPPTVAESCDEQGNWQVRVVPNKYPAVTGELGMHEVIIESPEHVTDPADLDVQQWTRILTVQRDRLRYWLADKRYQSVALFKNAGPAAGASLAHVHSQLTAFQFLPQGFAHELRRADAYRRERGDCYFSAAVTEAQSSGDRLVLADKNFTLLCPYPARLPYETWILPNEHQPRFEQVRDQVIAGLAEVLLTLLKALGSFLPDAAYNLMLHTAPAVDDFDESYRWHWKLLPRTSRLAGLELGSGVMINSVAPELAAERLRSTIH
ncbi:MAG: DUF4931 domain-containing protein [Lacipirellulaceae bacterium]